MPKRSTSQSTIPSSNRLLRALTVADFTRLKPQLQTIATPIRHLFHKPGKPVEYVYFPNAGVSSVTTVLTDGRMVESATVGREGMVGIEAFLTRRPVAQAETMVQVAPENTTAEMLPVGVLRQEMERNAEFADLLGRYSVALLRQTMHSTACNALHQVQERCARWLLMTHDRLEGDVFKLSHEYLAMMLGVRRQSVSVVAATLQAGGLITYRQGVVQIRDREGLEAASCECYGLIRREFDALSF